MGLAPAARPSSERNRLAKSIPCRPTAAGPMSASISSAGAAPTKGSQAGDTSNLLAFDAARYGGL